MLIFTRFTDLRSKAQFAVATYHMPCMFYLPPAMVIHAALAVQRTQVWHKNLLYQWHLNRHWQQLILITQPKTTSHERAFYIRRTNHSVYCFFLCG